MAVTAESKINMASPTFRNSTLFKLSNLQKTDLACIFDFKVKKSNYACHQSKSCSHDRLQMCWQIVNI